MTILECAKILLTYFSPEERSIPDSSDFPDRNAAVKKALNEALQQIFSKSVPWSRSDSRGEWMHAPMVVPITVTRGSTSATIAVEDWQSWFAGCIIRITGASIDNQIRNDSRTVVLKFPHDGESGTVDATVYHSSVTIGTDAFRVGQPVKFRGEPLTPVTSIGSSVRFPSENDYGFHRHVGALVAAAANTTGEPQFYESETWLPASGAPRLRLNIFPAPSADGFLEYETSLRAPSISDISATTTLPIPHDYVESLLLPVAVKKLRSCPFWAGMVGDAEVTDAYDAALKLLADAEPTDQIGIRIVAPY